MMMVLMVETQKTPRQTRACIIQGQILVANKYKAFTLKERCTQHVYTIQEYTKNHKAVAKVLHQQLPYYKQTTCTFTPWYKHRLLEDGKPNMYWDMTPNTGCRVSDNCPDIMVVDEKSRIALLIGIALLLGSKVQCTIREKLRSLSGASRRQTWHQ